MVMRINELFDKPQPTVPEDNPYIPELKRFNFEVNGDTYCVDILQENTWYTIGFKRVRPGGGIARREDFMATGKNTDQIKVLSTVISVLVKFFKDVPFTPTEGGIGFGANGSSRIRLYKRIASSLASKLGLAYKVVGSNEIVDFRVAHPQSDAIRY